MINDDDIVWRGLLDGFYGNHRVSVPGKRKKD